MGERRASELSLEVVVGEAVDERIDGRVAEDQVVRHGPQNQHAVADLQ